MELNDLDPTERVALAALVRFSVMSDGTLSEQETSEIGFVVTEIGEEAYRIALETASRRVKDAATLKALIAEGGRPEARELIYGTLLEAAIPDTIDPAESKLLELVAEVWGIKPEFEGFPEDGEAGEDEPL
jgi:hypothetical protein